MKYRLIQFFWGLCLPVIGFAQLAEMPAELRNKILHADTDSAKSIAYFDAARYYEEKGDVEKAIDYYKKCLKISEQSKKKELYSSTLDRIASIIINSNLDDPENIALLFESISILKKITKTDDDFLKLGIHYARLAGLNQTIKFTERANQYIDSTKMQIQYIKDYVKKEMLLYRVAKYYQNESITDSVLKYASELLVVGRPNKYRVALLTGYRIKVTTYLQNQEFSKALLYSDSVFLCHKDSMFDVSYKDAVAFDYNTRAHILEALGRWDAALEHYKISMQKAQSVVHKKWIVINAYDLGVLYQKLNNHVEALRYFMLSYETSKKENYYIDLLKATLKVAELHRLKNDFAIANTFLAQYIRLRDSLNSEVMPRAGTHSAYLKHEIINQEMLNRNLAEENEYKDLKIKAQFYKNTIYAAVILMLIILIFVGIWQHIKLRKSKNKLMQQNLIIETKNSEIATINEELTSNNEQLINILQEKDDLMAVVSHDLKSPINRALGLANLLYLENAIDQNTHKDLLSRLISELNNTKTMMSEILEAETLHSTAHVAINSKVPLRELIEEHLKKWNVIAEHKNIVIACNINSTAPLNVYGNHAHIQRMVDNLVSNAIKFSPKDSTVSVMVQPLNESIVRLSVTDQGPGIKEDERKNLFKKYQKLSAKPTAGETSTGLGLSIVKTLAEAMDANVGVESEVGKGSTFYVDFKKV